MKVTQQLRQTMRQVRRLPDRCPHCGGARMVRLALRRPLVWCRCPVRRAVALGA